MLAEQTRRPDTLTYETRVQRIPTHWLLRELERRGVPAPPASVPLIRVPADAPLLEINRTWRTATWRGRTTTLTTRECDVLALLAASYPAPLAGGAVAAAVWPDGGQERLLLDPTGAARVYVMYLRRKLPGLIETTDAGYVLAPEATP